MKRSHAVNSREHTRFREQQAKPSRASGSAWQPAREKKKVPQSSTDAAMQRLRSEAAVGRWVGSVHWQCVTAGGDLPDHADRVSVAETTGKF